ncbi:MAG: antitoxin component YwqK of YwqJK toxin-antitoxin module [Crocinitomicaceae bacterium]|jgi:antitoxin component YwqK of YwqJK toxin-antitoxin module
MKLISIIFILASGISRAQTCDTLYSNDKFIARTIDISYRNCHLVEIDSVYRIRQKISSLDEYNESYFIYNQCHQLFNSETGRLIQQQWKSNDTTYFKEYYSSGALKVTSMEYVDSEYRFWWRSRREYHENGNLKREYDGESLALYPCSEYYPDGSLLSTAHYYGIFEHRWGDYIEYFPNGQVSSFLRYSLPITNDSIGQHYQSSQLLSTFFYSTNGKEVTKDLNEEKYVRINIYPPDEHEVYLLNDSLYVYTLFEDQKGYSNEMMDLKAAIIDKLKIPAKCNCAIGVALISLLITKEGRIVIAEIEFPDGKLKKSIAKALKEIKSWPAGQYQDQNVDTAVYLDLIFDE